VPRPCIWAGSAVPSLGVVAGCVMMSCAVVRYAMAPSAVKVAVVVISVAVAVTVAAHVGPAEGVAAKPAFHPAFVEHNRNRIVVDGKRLRLIVRGSDSLSVNQRQGWSAQPLRVFFRRFQQKNYGTAQ
jgi:hypothetical protein